MERLIIPAVQQIYAAHRAAVPTMSDLLIVKNAVRQFVPDDYQVSAEFYEELSEHVEEEIAKAGERAEGNGRKTLKPRDL